MEPSIINIAVTGHIDLRPEDLVRIEKRCVEVIKQIAKENHTTNVRILVGHAEGSDQLIQNIDWSPTNLYVTYSILRLSEKITGIKRSDCEIVIPAQKIDEDEWHSKGYEDVAKELITQAHHLLALWDGVFVGKQGGTSEVVRMAIDSDKKMKLHHLVVPRMSNPYPVASLFPKGIHFKNNKFDRIPFTIHFSCIELQLNPKNEDSKLRKGWITLKSWIYSEIFYSFLLPMLLVLLTLVLGTIGFSQYGVKNFHDALFSAVNLLTFNNSVLEIGAVSPDIPILLNIARYLGIATAITAFTIALYLALGKKRKQLRLWWWKTFSNSHYTVVLGLSPKSLDLINDLLKKDRKVALLSPSQDLSLTSELEKKGIIHIEGDVASASALRQIHHHTAQEIYIMSDVDTENVRAVQELDILGGNERENQRWFVHLHNMKLRNYTSNILSKNGIKRISIFDVYENMARRLQLYFPMDRFYQTPEANVCHIVIFGFSNVGKKIMLNALQLGHFQEGQHLEISVFCKDSEEATKQFKNEYPIFKNEFHEQAYLEDVVRYVWPKPILQFHELPASDGDLLSDRFVLFDEIISAKNIVTIYSCFEEGLTAASYLSLLLPKVNAIAKARSCNLQAFSFYNFPDKREELFTESKFNRLAPNIPVFCFGNFLDECSTKLISSLALDILAKQIAYWYAQQYGDASKGIEEVWMDCSEQEKEANRKAADHIWIKIRSVWNDINWEHDPDTYEVPVIVDRKTGKEINDELELMLAEVEHRRWCANLLLRGFRPLADRPNSKDQVREFEKQWFEKGNKKSFKEQYLHLDLLPYDQIMDTEKGKDLNQIHGITRFLREIVLNKNLPRSLKDESKGTN